jgi:hypothetical protein
MSWCESKDDIYYLFGISKKNRLLKRIRGELKKAKMLFHKTGQARRIYKDFTFRTFSSWSKRKRLIGKR